MDPEFWQELREKNALNRHTSDSKEEDKGKPLADSDKKRDDTNAKANHSDLYHAVPAELKALRQWVVWREEKRDGKPTKIPYQLNGKNAQSNNPDTWTDFVSVSKQERIGFVFSPNDSYCGIDLDHCLDVKGKLKAWAEPIIMMLKPVAYGEVSPSGNGIKFWTKARLPVLAKHKVYLDEATSEAIEAYDSGRYFTVTGKGKGTIGAGQSAIDWLVAEHLKTKPVESPPPPRSVPTSSNLTVDEVIGKIRASKQCHKFDALMAGNTTGYGSQSEADLALCGVITFWTQEPSVIDAIFRQSKLYNRPKWDERHRADGATYGQMTIEAALSGERETYKPHQRKLLSKTKRRLYRDTQLYGRKS